MSKIPQIKNENNKNSETVPLTSGETKQNGLSRMLSQIEVSPWMKGLGVAVFVVVVVAYPYPYGAASSTTRRIYKGGFRPEMTRREAALILGVRGSTAADKVTEAHRRLMVANHPDRGGSHYIASKINEAKDLLIRKQPKATDSIFSYKISAEDYTKHD